MAGLYLSGLLSGAENELADLRFRLAKRDATADLVLVGIDAQSIQELEIWPWPRSLHATVIDNLIAAGAERIALDIDFSSISQTGEDLRLEQSLSRANGAVILPTFVQRHSTGDSVGLAVSAPLARFREHAAIASINLMPGADGLVRSMAHRQPWPDGTSMPTLAAALSGNHGGDEADFFIDFGIVPESIPTISYVDVLTGHFDPRDVIGRKVLVSVTAIELGDMVPVPLVRSMPGGLLQALAYQSLVQDRALRPMHPAIVIGLAASMVFFSGAVSRRWSWRRSLALTVGAVLGVLLISGAVYALSPLVLDATPAIVGLSLVFVWSLVQRLDLQSVQLLLQAVRLRRTEATMRHVVENSFDGIITFGADARIETANAAACRIFGYERTEMIGLDLGVLLPDFDQVPSNGGTIRTAAHGVSEMSGRHKEACTFPVDVALSNTTNDDREIYIAVLRDISERKQQQNVLLEAKRKAEEADQMKSAFLAQMSHELRTPLNAVIGFSELIAGEMFGPVGSARYKEYATDILTSGKHLLGIVNDILDMSKLEAGKYELQESEIDVSRLVGAALTLIGHPERVPQTVHVEVATELPKLRADERAVTQVLVNLLSNAVKFTSQDGAVYVTASCGADDPFRITVRDTGIGMRLGDISIALTPFRQIDSRVARNYEGTGLGLPIAAALMKLHGGSLLIESEPDKGTSVTLEFPVERVLRRAAATAGGERSDSAGPRASTNNAVIAELRPPVVRASTGAR